MSLEQIKEDALVYGYDFEELLASLKNNHKNMKEYIYGYSISDDKDGYLESMAKDEVIGCDRIFYFEEELKDYLHQIELKPHTQIMSGFLVLKNAMSDYEKNCNASTFRILSINDDTKRVFVKDIEYMNYGIGETLCVYHADISYNKAIQEIYTNTISSLFTKVEELTSGFYQEFEIIVE